MNSRHKNVRLFIVKTIINDMASNHNYTTVQIKISKCTNYFLRLRRNRNEKKKKK